MAACGSLQHIFEKPMPENPTLLESLSSWNRIKSSKPIEDSSFTEIFGELHFKENPESSSLSSLSSLSSSSSPQARVENEGIIKSPSSDYFSSNHRKQFVGSHKNSDSFSSMNSESLQLCTEGLGFESSDDVEDLKTDVGSDLQSQEDRMSIAKQKSYGFRRSRRGGGTFPPPISSIGKSGKPWVCFKSYRHDGRFVLKEIRIPNQEFLHARREDGRLILQLCQSDDEILEEDDGEDDNEEESDRDSDTTNAKEEENIDEKNAKLNSNGVGGDSDS